MTLGPGRRRVFGTGTALRPGAAHLHHCDPDDRQCRYRLREARSGQRDVDCSEPDERRQHDRRCERLSTRCEPWWPREPHDPFASARHVRWWQNLVGMPDCLQLDLPGDGRSGRRLRCCRSRVLRDARLQVCRPTNGLNPDIVVANSGDGGKTWESVRSGRGQWKLGSVGDLLDKGKIAAWGDGNAIVTWGDFRTAPQKKPGTARIYASVTTIAASRGRRHRSSRATRWCRSFLCRRSLPTTVSSSRSSTSMISQPDAIPTRSSK